MTDWNYADVWEVVADVQPEAAGRGPGGPAGSTGREFDHRADGVARWLLELGGPHQDKVALYLYNCARVPRVDVRRHQGRPRPGQHQLPLRRRRAGLPVGQRRRRRPWSSTGRSPSASSGSGPGCPGSGGGCGSTTASGPCPDWATPYEEVAWSTRGRVRAPWGRSGDDLIMLYTGGTTGMPKGVMWRQDDLFARLNAGGFRRYDETAASRASAASSAEAGPGMLAAPGLPADARHRGLHRHRSACSEGGRVVLLERPPLRPGRAARHGRAREGQRPGHRGRPVRPADARPPSTQSPDAGTSRRSWASSRRGPCGARRSRRACSATTRACCWSTPSARQRPWAWARRSRRPGPPPGRPSSPWVPRCGSSAPTAGRSSPGSDEIGVLALGGRNPLGYYKDEDKTAATFRIIDGVRYSIPGDYAQVRRGRLDPPARPGFGVHQHRPGRRSSPRRSKRPQDPPHGARRRGGRRARRHLRPADRGRGRAGAGLHRRRRGGADRAREGPPGRLQGAPAGPGGRDHRAGPQRQGRLRTPPPGGDRVGGRRRPEPAAGRLPPDENVFYLASDGVQPRRPLRGRRRRLSRSGVPGGQRRAPDLRRDGGPGQPAGPPPGGPGHRAGGPRRDLLVQQRGMGRDRLGRLQASGGVDQHQLPLRRRRAAVPVHQRRPEGHRLPARVRTPGGHARCPNSRRVEHVVVVEDGTDEPLPDRRRRLRGGPGRRVPERDFGPRSPDDLYILYTGGTTGHAQGSGLAPRRRLLRPGWRGRPRHQHPGAPTRGDGREGPGRP